jgi:short-subunit dehydrogenase
MQLGRAVFASAVAADIVKALQRNRSRVVPGRIGKFLLSTLMTAPRSLRVRIMQGIMRSMTPHV